MWVRFIAILVLVILSPLAPPAHAQSRLWTRPEEAGVWLPYDSGCTQALGSLRAEWEGRLQKIATLVRACPTFKDIRGYYPLLSGCVMNPGGSVGPYGASLMLLIWPPETIERTPKGEPQVIPRWRYNHPVDTGSLMILVNSIGDLRDWFSGEDKEGKFYELPGTSREVAGFPVVGNFLLISPPGKPPVFTPITQERAQRWILDNLKRQAAADTSILESARKQYEEFISPAGLARRAKEIEAAAASQRKPENQELERRQAKAKDQRREQDLKAATLLKSGSPETRTQGRVAQLEARLTGLSPEQRRQPAWYKPHPEGVRRLDYGDIVEADTAGARPLVVPNPNYFDLKLPKATMQLVSIPGADHYKELAGKGRREIQIRVPMEVIDQLDWRAIAAMLK